jgi:GNAT superfamily N-acetyltransferase/N-acetylglutamate synthase-like GNAT family acetyltransferase
MRQITKDESVEPYIRLWNARRPEMPKDRAQAQLELNYYAGLIEQDWLIERDGQPAGIVCVVNYEGKVPAEWVECDLLTHENDEAEIAGALIDKAIAVAQEMGASRLGIWTDSRCDWTVSELAKRGFERNQVAPVSRMSLDQPVPQRLLEKRGQAVSRGYRFASLEELTAEGYQWLEPLYQASTEMREGQPFAEPVPQVPFDDWKQNVTTSPVYQKNLMHVFMDGQKIIGYTRVQGVDFDPEIILTGYTGVVPSYRRQGLATALKVASIENLAQQGYKWLVTDNDETNPMYALNVELGFSPVFEFWRYNKVLA